MNAAKLATLDRVNTPPKASKTDAAAQHFDGRAYECPFIILIAFMIALNPPFWQIPHLLLQRASLISNRDLSICSFISFVSFSIFLTSPFFEKITGFNFLDEARNLFGKIAYLHITSLEAYFRSF